VHQPVRSGPGPAVRRRHLDARRRDGWRVRSGSISDYIQSLERLKGLNSRILLSGHGRLSDTPQDDVRIAIQRSHALLSDTRNCSTRSTRVRISSPIMQSVRDLNKLDDS